MSVSPRTAWRTALGLALLVSGGVAAATVAGAEDPAAPTEVVPVTPYRILDTRTALGAAGPITAGQSIDVQIGGVGPVPANAIGVVLNVTGTQASQPTWVTAWPTGSERPNASVLNLQPGVDSPNAVTALLGPNGQVSLYNDSGSVHLIADVAGYLLPAGTGGQAGPAGPQGPAGPAGPASASALGVEVVTEVGTVPTEGASGVKSATCPAGKVVIAGGGQANGADEIVLRSSYTVSSDNWQVAYSRELTGGVDPAVNFTVYAVCVNA